MGNTKHQQFTTPTWQQLATTGAFNR